jgi:D-aspartate ligase
VRGRDHLLTAVAVQTQIANPAEVALEAKRQGVGALVIGGDHSSLAIARSLGRIGIPVYMLEDQHSIATYSRFADKIIRVKDLRDHVKTVDSVMEVGQRFALDGWVLFPTRDENVAAFSLHRERLSRLFRVTTPPWRTTKWAWNKNNSYALADELGIPCPRTWIAGAVDELGALESRLPLAIKPAVKENFFYATGAKAWRANTPQQLRKLYTDALQRVPAEEVMIQEIIPGDGQRQLSYCAFFKDGKAHSTLMARRLRQYPREFGRAATYVESVDVPEIEELSERFLRAIDFYGLVEIEFKLDPRDNQYKLLDVNARAWGFHGLGQAAGVDFPLLVFADQIGLQLEPRRAAPGIGWLRALTDIPVATSEMLRGYLTPGTYLESIRRTRAESVFSVADPLPWFAEALLLPFLIFKKHSER